MCVCADDVSTRLAEVSSSAATLVASRDSRCASKARSAAAARRSATPSDARSSCRPCCAAACAMDARPPSAAAACGGGRLSRLRDGAMQASPEQRWSLMARLQRPSFLLLLAQGALRLLAERVELLSRDASSPRWNRVLEVSHEAKLTRIRSSPQQRYKMIACVCCSHKASAIDSLSRATT